MMMENTQARLESFLPYGAIENLSRRKEPREGELEEVLSKALRLQGLLPEEAAVLLAATEGGSIRRILDAAKTVKEAVYGDRMVLFAPLYTGNRCSNNCLYCGFRRDNRDIRRRTLTEAEILREVELLLAQGHKRLLVLCGETDEYSADYVVSVIDTVYRARRRGAGIRRVNVEIAPLDGEGFRTLKTARIGTYTCFQETYHPGLYAEYHPSGKKADYLYRLMVMHRAMEAGIDDVGIGALFGLADYRYDTLALLYHAAELERVFGCGPHTVSVPRIEPAAGAPLTEAVPFPVSDDEFRKIVAVIRLALPYTGIILSTRERRELRDELFNYGVSQISAGSRTNPGGYSSEDDGASQFSLGDHRSLEEVIAELIRTGHIPSFCTGCYRKGRTGNDFMDLAKPGLIRRYCFPNGMFSFAEYLLDYASPLTREAGFALLEKLTGDLDDPEGRRMVRENLAAIHAGERDVYV
jgi:2-iminoacetate synthase